MLIKKKHYRPIPEGAEIITRNGRQYARWTNSRGKRITRPLNARGDRLAVESRCWYVRVKGPDGKWHERKAYADKAASAALEVELITRLERGEVGLVDPLEEHRKRPLEEHLQDFEAHLEDRGNSVEYVELTAQRCRTIFKRTKAKIIEDITPGRVEACLGELRREGLSVSTCNHYFRALRNFCRWLVKDRRAAANPIAGLSAMKVTEQDKKRRRRPFTDEEFATLIRTTRSSSADFRGLSGEDRAMLYIVAFNTGLRVCELASLTPESFDLDSDVPTVCCRAAYTKNGQEAVLPLRTDVAAALKDWLATKPAGEPVWPGTWAKKASARMLRMDLAAAGIPYEDASGRFADFHSLRHTFISNLARGGVHPKNAQALARHSKITLTMDHYTHTVLGDLARDVESLPAVPVAEVLAATGTDGAPHGGARLRDKDRLGERPRRRTKWRKNPGLECQNGANRCIGRQDRPGAPSGDQAERKSLPLADKGKACQHEESKNWNR